MNTTHDDLPHPIPPIAYLRWKENYFFIVLDVENDVFGMAHFNHEPAFDRARMSCNLQIKGKAFRYSNQIPFPEKFEMSPELGDGRLRLTIVESHRRFKLALNADDFAFDLLFENRFPTYDFDASAFAAPELMSFREAMTLNTNLQYNHIQQAMKVSGSVTADSKQIVVRESYGYRDHSWSMRSDNLVADHTWCGLNFPNRVFGVMTLETLIRPGTVAKEGYVADADGVRALRAIEVTRLGRSEDGLPDKLVHELRDVYGTTYRIESDIGARLAQVPLSTEPPNSKGHYNIAEIFARSVLTETGDKGISLIEIGRHSSLGERK